ncbi:MAG: HEAT repeat domain-containing protein [Chloroflexota bacterium]
MSVKRVLQYHINRLKDKRPEIRLDAIRELELLGDPDALEPLRAVYDRDEDIQVRKAAQRAGRAIFLSNNSTGAY